MQTGDAVRTKIDSVATVLKIIADVGGDVGIVFDDEYAHGKESSLPEGRTGKVRPPHAGKARTLGKALLECFVSRALPGFGQKKSPGEVWLGNPPRLS
jgi:hypothetical protein